MARKTGENNKSDGCDDWDFHQTFQNGTVTPAQSKEQDEGLIS